LRTINSSCARISRIDRSRVARVGVTVGLDPTFQAARLTRYGRRGRCSSLVLRQADFHIPLQFLADVCHLIGKHVFHAVRIARLLRARHRHDLVADLRLIGQANRSRASSSREGVTFKLRIVSRRVEVVSDEFVLRVLRFGLLQRAEEGGISRCDVPFCYR
jgi:hypothetical protein